MYIKWLLPLWVYLNPLCNSHKGMTFLFIYRRCLACPSLHFCNSCLVQATVNAPIIDYYSIKKSPCWYFPTKACKFFFISCNLYIYLIIWIHKLNISNFLSFDRCCINWFDFTLEVTNSFDVLPAHSLFGLSLKLPAWLISSGFVYFVLIT